MWEKSKLFKKKDKASNRDTKLLRFGHVIILVLHICQLLDLTRLRHVLDQLLQHGHRQIALIHFNYPPLDLLVWHFDGAQQNGCHAQDIKLHTPFTVAFVHEINRLELNSQRFCADLGSNTRSSLPFLTGFFSEFSAVLSCSAIMLPPSGYPTVICICTELQRRIHRTYWEPLMQSSPPNHWRSLGSPTWFHRH